MWREELQLQHDENHTGKFIVSDEFLYSGERAVLKNMANTIVMKLFEVTENLLL